MKRRTVKTNPRSNAPWRAPMPCSAFCRPPMSHLTFMGPAEVAGRAARGAEAEAGRGAVGPAAVGSVFRVAGLDFPEGTEAAWAGIARTRRELQPSRRIPEATQC